MWLLNLLGILVILLVIGYFSILLYMKSQNKEYKSTKRLDGKTCLVTGGTNGIGLEIAIDFAKRGGRVIVACPFEEEGNNAEKKIIEQSGNRNVSFKFLNLGSFKSIRKFAEDVLNTEARLDILMNNAGVAVPLINSEDGLDMTMQVNYLGHFLLTLLLLPLLKKSGTPTAPSRIVNTSSVLHQYAAFKLDIEILANPSKNVMEKHLNYSHTKLCLILFSRELPKRLLHSNVVINSVDPGAVATSIFLDTKQFHMYFMYLAFQLCAKTPYEGAQTPIFAALDETAGQTSGQFYRNLKPCQSSEESHEQELARKLWDKSVKLVKLGEDELSRLLQ